MAKNMYSFSFSLESDTRFSWYFLSNSVFNRESVPAKSPVLVDVESKGFVWELAFVEDEMTGFAGPLALGGGTGGVFESFLGSFSTLGFVFEDLFGSLALVEAAFSSESFFDPLSPVEASFEVFFGPPTLATAEFTGIVGLFVEFFLLMRLSRAFIILSNDFQRHVNAFDWISRSFDESIEKNIKKRLTIKNFMRSQLS